MILFRLVFTGLGCTRSEKLLFELSMEDELPDIEEGIDEEPEEEFLLWLSLLGFEVLYH